MYIVAIGWLYITILMAMTETSVIAGVLTFVFYGAAPLALLLWIFGMPTRRRRRLSGHPIDNPVGDGDGADTQQDK